MRSRRAAFARAALVATVLLAASMSCSAVKAPAEQDPAKRAQVLIESGNEAYRQGDYRLAVRRYAAAAVVRKDDPAAYYGMGMSLSKLGRDEEARTAYAKARELTQTERSGAPRAGGTP